MLIDCSRSQPPGNLDTDVVIIGSGAAGLTLSLALSEKGIANIVVEAGPEKFSKAAQELFRAASIDPEAHGPVHMYRRRAFGGTTAIWGGRCIPFDPIDFEDRPWMPGATWPVSYDEIAAYYPRALDICRAGSPSFEAESALPGEPGALIDGVISPDVILDRIERFSEPTHFGDAYRNRLEASKSATILVGAAVTRIDCADEGARCVGVTARTAQGDIRIGARRTVIAAGGLETARLLLASNQAISCGLGNQRDLVGRYYQGHVEGEVGEIQFNAAPEDVRLDYQRTSEGIYVRRYIWLSPEVQRREQLCGLIARPYHPNIVDPEHRNPVLSAMYLVKSLIVAEYSRKLTSTEQQVRAAFGGRQAALAVAHLGNVLRHPLALAQFSVDWARRRVLATRKLPSVVLRDPRNRYPLDINAEQAPNFDSRVELSDERDQLGIPKLSIRWRMTADDHDRIARGVEIMRRGMATSPLVSVEVDGLEARVSDLTRVGGHHIGTARMASVPQSGVVDADCAVFGTHGLFVSGAAAFPTSGFANPTLTIVALALRLGDHLGNSP